VNVHPTKMQVRFREPGEVFKVAQRAVRRALHEKFPVPTVAPMSAFPGTSPRPGFQNQGIGAAMDLVPPANGQQGQAALAGMEQANSALAPSAAALPLLRVLGQIFSTYIICEGPDGLYLIDQHAAHERVLYDRWLTEGGAAGATQELLEPLPVELSPLHWAAYESEKSYLDRAGFRIEPFGGQTVLLRGVPVVLRNKEPRKTFLEILELTDEGGNPIQAEAEARLVMSICKGAAIKGGQVMALEEMRALVRDLERTKSPRTCPHGRPTMILMNTALLEREFGRRG
jgi:DNA mismatch repair protein MutL